MTHIQYTFDRNNGTPTLVQAAYTKEKPENYKNHGETETIDSYYTEIPEYRAGVVNNSNRLNDLNATAHNLKEFVESTKANGGYYIARYEASYASGNSTSDYKAASKKSKANSTSSMDYTVGTLWNFITQLDASKVSINTYSKENATVKKLCMGYGNSVYRGSWKYKLCKSN